MPRRPSTAQPRVRTPAAPKFHDSLGPKRATSPVAAGGAAVAKCARTVGHRSNDVAMSVESQGLQAAVQHASPHVSRAPRYRLTLDSTCTAAQVFAFSHVCSCRGGPKQGGEGRAAPPQATHVTWQCTRRERLWHELARHELCVQEQRVERSCRECGAGGTAKRAISAA